ncbi:hypothetical protein RND81_12G209700 [Saponaria officinalis]|uniref:Uncharacterized protein n=1 Tax=Saponaria officinalis TaxID=3572 RepID=A0AAW1HDG6_SAPOF
MEILYKSGIEMIKKAIRNSLEQEKKSIEENYGRLDPMEELYNQSLEPILWQLLVGHVKSGLTYFQAERHDTDYLFLVNIDKEQPKKYNSRMRSKIYDQVVILLLECSTFGWEIIEKMSDAANDTRFYDAVITAAATLAIYLYTPEDLYRCSNRRLHYLQLNNLWKQFYPREKGMCNR